MFKEDSSPKLFHKTGRVNKGLLEPRKSLVGKHKTNIKPKSLLKSSGHVERGRAGGEMRKSKPSRLHCIFVTKTIDSVIKWCFSEGKHRNSFWRIIKGVVIKNPPSETCRLQSEGVLRLQTIHMYRTMENHASLMHCNFLMQQTPRVTSPAAVIAHRIGVWG